MPSAHIFSRRHVSISAQGHLYHQMTDTLTRDYSHVTALVLCAQAGDRDAFDRLAVQFRAGIYALALLRTGSRDDAEDVTQEVLSTAWRHIGVLRVPEAFVSWLRTIALNVCRGRRRTSSTPESLAILSDHYQSSDPGPLTVLVARECRHRLRLALLALPEKNRIALLLHVWGQYGYADIAMLMKVPMTTIEGRIYRAKQQLRRMLDNEADDLFEEKRRLWREERGGI